MTDEARNLYIARVDMTPHFLDPGLAAGNPGGAQEGRNEFVHRLRGTLHLYMDASPENKAAVEEQNPLLPPYIAIVGGDHFFKDAMVTVDQFSMSASPIEGDQVLCRIAGKEQRLPIDEGLVALLGRPQFPNDTKMNLVVEFGTADYLSGIQELAGYTIHRLN
jgi:hypothetical protein